MSDQTTSSDPERQPPGLPGRPSARTGVGWVAADGTMDKLSRVLQPLCVGLMDEMVEITVFCPEDCGLEELPSPPVEVVRYAAPGVAGYRRKGLVGAVAAARARKLDLLHALEAPAAPLTARLAHLCDLDYVVSCYSLNDARRLGSLDAAPRAVFGASEAVVRCLSDQRVIEPASLDLVRPGVYHVDSPTCFSDPQLSVTIVADGPMDQSVPWETFLHACAELKGAGCDCAFFCMGGGQAQKRIRAAAVKLRLSGELTFVERQNPSQLAGILKAADVYVSPVPTAELDLHSLLAMAAGTPVLSTPTVVNDFLVPGLTTEVFMPSSASELTAKLRALVENKGRAVSLAARALDHIRANHSAASMVAAVAGAYRKIVAAP